MAKIKNIEFKNFRNFQAFKTAFDDRLNIFFGNNGCGKTNILEGISLVAKGRGIRNSHISNLINKKGENFLIKNSLDIKDNHFDIEIFSENTNNKFKKIIKINDDQSKDSVNFLYQSISFLTFVPEMERLFQSTPSYRRNFLDRLIFSGKNKYNTLINKYKKLLIERIKILQNDIVDIDWLNNVEQEICKFGLEIYQLRFSQISSINKNINNLKKNHNFPLNIHLLIKDDFVGENTTFEEYLSNLLECRKFDSKYGKTKIGPHRSDIIAKVNNDFDASLLSTGQQKTVVLMILLAQCNHLVNYKNIKPILLFDEIGSHLDEHNRQILLDMINKFDIQFFLTGTDKNLFSFVSTNAQFYNISDI